MMPRRTLHIPFKLRGDLFTPQTRTPWGGTALGQGIKARWLKPEERGTKIIGESWELSWDPQMPSKSEDGTLLSTLALASPEEFGLTPEETQWGGGTLMVKLLHAALPLSVQVHPKDEDPFLSPQECGKPEAWFVLESKPGSGIYLGFSKILTPGELQKILDNKEDLEPYLQFVPVSPGMFFVIPPGVPHALGPDVLIAEPQRVIPGLSGKTYRLWDWNRKYSHQGVVQGQEEEGSPRPLHVKEALPILDLVHQVGLPFVNSLRRFPKSLSQPHLRWDFYEGLHENLHFLEGTPPGKTLLRETTYGLWISLAGDVELASEKFPEKTLLCQKGETLIIPQKSWPINLVARTPFQGLLITPKREGKREPFHG